MASVPLISIYTKNLERSMDFYEYVFGCSIPQITNGFAILAITDNVAITLAQAVSRVSHKDSIGGGVEISLNVGGVGEVEEIYSRFKEVGAGTPCKLTNNDYGCAFVGVDPDGHRLRVCSPPTRSR